LGSWTQKYSVIMETRVRAAGGSRRWVALPVLHSNSSKASGTFTARVEVFHDYVWIEVEDDSGLWREHTHHDGRPHGLDIVRKLAAGWA
jgi:hypothetical protein